MREIYGGGFEAIGAIWVRRNAWICIGGCFENIKVCKSGIRGRFRGIEIRIWIRGVKWHYGEIREYIF